MEVRKDLVWEIEETKDLPEEQGVMAKEHSRISLIGLMP